MRPGDTILFRRGDTWHEQLTLTSSGAPDYPITIDAYGSGDPPILDEADPIPPNLWSKCTACPVGVWQAPVASRPNVVIAGFRKANRKSDLDDVRAPDDWFWASGILYLDAASNPSSASGGPVIEAGARPTGIDMTGRSYVTVKNVEVRGANAVPFSDGAGIWASTVHISGPTPHHLVISNVTVIDGAGDGIHLENSDASTIEDSAVAFNDGSGIKIYGNNDRFLITSGLIRGNQVHQNHSNGINIFGCPPGTRCRSVVYPEGVVVSGLKIIGNTVHDNGAGIYLHETNQSLVSGNSSFSNKDTSSKGEGYCVGLSGSSSNIVEKNECYDARLSAIELSIDTGRPALGSSDNIIRYNEIHDDGTNGIFTNYVPSRDNQFLYNLIYNHPNGSCVMANYNGHKIYNNTCYNNRIGIHLYISASTRETGDIDVKNNIIADSSKYQVLVEPGVEGPLDFSDNDYFPDGRNAFNWKGSPLDFASWRSETRQDANSMVADPRFAGSPPSKPSDFAPRSDSPAVARAEKMGENFSNALSPSPLDWPAQVELVRQIGNRWDIGALHHLP
ncbi:MAG TPA: right-handed parallel beta-helix repeat-containing protein [Verrucomicrobiae bacterium]|nr:right-handed parallel beta-helix repeat-containing protein [Verrucomicrobiae bacterium]